MFDGLADQHPVKWVLVDIRQVWQGENIVFLQWQPAYQMTLAFPGDKLLVISSLLTSKIG